MHRDWAPCLACDAAVPRDARTCSSCGYDVATHDRRRLLLGGLGTALALSVVLAPVGLALVRRARAHRLAAEGTVTRRGASEAPEPLAVLRAFLSLDPREGRGELRRGRRVRGSADAVRR